MSMQNANKTDSENELLDELRRAMDDVQAIDCHDRVAPREQVLECGDMLFHLFVTSCLPRGVVAADPALQQHPADPAQSWKTLEPHLPNLRNTSAYRCVVEASRLLYDFTGFPLDEKGYAELRERMASAYNQADWYVQALRNRAKVDTVVWAVDSDIPLPEQERDLLLPTPNLDVFIRAHERPYKELLEQRYHVKLLEFADLMDLLNEALTEFDEKGVPAFWTSFSRFRPLIVRTVGPQEAAAAFRKPDDQVTPEEARLFQDHIIHQIAERCAALNLPLQMDTGAQANPMSVEHSDPCQLAGFVATHTRTRFVFLHGGYPFARHLGAQAKTFPNTYVDGSSLAAHSLSAVKEVVGEWIELVPVGKLLLWGGNTARIESAVGSLLLMKDALAEILADRVENGFFSRELAFDLARKILRDVPRRFYRTEEIRVRRKISAEAVD
ncbi:MAG: amidohydrolase family protein [Planctomycetota bacterium]